MNEWMNEWMDEWMDGWEIVTAKEIKRKKNELHSLERKRKRAIWTMLEVVFVVVVF